MKFLKLPRTLWEIQLEVQKLLQLKDSVPDEKSIESWLRHHERSGSITTHQVVCNEMKKIDDSVYAHKQVFFAKENVPTRS
jgi:hypothetical protein